MVGSAWLRRLESAGLGLALCEALPLAALLVLTLEPSCLRPCSTMHSLLFFRESRPLPRTLPIGLVTVAFPQAPLGIEVISGVAGVACRKIMGTLLGVKGVDVEGGVEAKASVVSAIVFSSPSAGELPRVTSCSGTKFRDFLQCGVSIEVSFGGEGREGS